ncbi:MAG TPA: hypothetical protein PKH19_00970 [Candidatus Syntrophosphaera sp.]|nr:hypothetical protein [Candidatus Syntrophosphaera sp.]
MSIILDIIGSVIIGSLLLLMLITFQYRMQEAGDRYVFMQEMTEHIDLAAVKLNKVIALAGVGFPANTTVVHAATDSLVFNTYWNYETDSLQSTPVTISIRLTTLPSPYGKTLVIRQDGVPLNDLGYIFWVTGLSFKYYDRYDALTTTKANVRAAELWLTFSRASTPTGSPDLINKIQVKCFLMNTYMRGA